MKNNEKPDILSRIRNMKFRKELTALLAFFVMISTSYAMIHPGEALNNNVARSFMFFEEEQGTEEENKGELINAGDLLDKEREAEAVYTEAPAAEENTDSQEDGNTVSESQTTQPAEQNSYPPTSTPAESVTPVFDSTAAPVVSASTEPEGKETSEPTGTPESLVSASPEASENTETADPENSPSASPDATASTDPSASPSVEPTGSPEAEEEEVLYPAVDFGEITPLEEDGTETKEDIKVVIKAPEGAFPEGTTVNVVLVRDTEVLEAIEKAAVDAAEDNVEVKEVKAVDITFTYKGEEIQPKKAIAVSFKSSMIEESKETTVVHVEQDKENNNEIVGAKAVDKIEAPEHSELVDEIKDNEVVIEADSFSVYGIVGTEILTTKVITADGESYTIEVTYGPEAGIPSDAELKATEIAKGTEEYNKYLAQATVELFGKISEQEDGIESPTTVNIPEELSNISSARFFDVEIWANGEKIEPTAAVTVTIRYDDPIEMNAEDQIMAVHFKADGRTEIMTAESAEGEKGGTDVTFEQDSFSVTGTVVVNGGSTWPTTEGKYAVIFKDPNNGQTYALKSDGSIANVTVSGNKVTFSDNIQTVADIEPYLWNYRREEHTGSYWGGTYTYYTYHIDNGEGVYIDPSSTSGISDTERNLELSNGYLYTNANYSYYAVGTNPSEYRLNRIGYSFGYGGGWESTPATLMLANNFEAETDVDPVPAEGELGDPDTKKVVTNNEDGTYTLAISVTGKSATSKTSNKADVIIVYDYSGSMNYPTNNVSATGQYGYLMTNQGDRYVQLYYISNNRWQTANNNTPATTTVYYSQNVNSVYTGPRYSATTNNPTTRLTIANNAIGNATDGLVKKLLDNNGGDNPSDTVRVALVNFSNDASTQRFSGSNWTTNLTAFRNALPSSATGGTNWGAALYNANQLVVESQNNTERNADTYVIFVSDGNPTYYRTSSGGRGGTGYETDSNIEDSYNSAKGTANSITTNGAEFYTVGVFGNVSRMESLTAYAYHGDDSATEYPDGHYQTATDSAALNEAFAKIIDAINNRFIYEDIKINDGITNMSASALVDGTPDNFEYFRNDQPWDRKETVDGVERTANEATYVVGDDGKKSVVWNLGEDFVLQDKVKYTVSFTIWPTQRAYDYVADLNNGLIAFDDLDSDIQAQIYDMGGGKYAVKTNTTASVAYDTIKYDDQGNKQTLKNDVTVPIAQPDDGMGLDESSMRIGKDWETDLDPGQLLKLLEKQDFDVHLTVTNDNENYVHVHIAPIRQYDSSGKIIGATWPDETVYIAPGIMLSASKAAEKDLVELNSDGSIKSNPRNYQTIDYNGTTYVILEPGHEYSIDEHNGDYHYELKAETYHPMVVDGKVRNVKFTYTEGSISGIEAIDTTNEGRLVATNSLKAGINVRKIVKDADGNEFYPTDQLFFFRVSLTDSNGTAIKYSNYSEGGAATPYYDSSKAIDSSKESVHDRENATVSVNVDTYPIWYNIYEGAKDDMDLEGTYYPEGAEFYNRSEGMVAEDGSIIAIKAGEVIRFANVPIGTQVKLEEVNVPNGYGFSEYKYKEGKTTTTWTTEENMTTGYSLEAEGNQSYYFTFTNEQQTSDMVIVKTDNRGNAITSANDTAIFKLTRNNKFDGTGSWENATATSGVAEDGTITINTTDGINLIELKDGLYKLQENKAPDGYVIISDPVYFKLNGGSIQFVNVEGSGSSTVITEIDTPDGYTVVEKTDSTPVTLKVANTPGAALPNTGGSGTLPYTLSGIALLMASALMYGFRMRRRERRLN